MSRVKRQVREHLLAPYVLGESSRFHRGFRPRTPQAPQSPASPWALLAPARALRPSPAPTCPYKGPAHPPTPVLHIEEAAARAVRPRSLARRVIQLLRWADLHAPALVRRENRASFQRLAGLTWFRPLDALLAAGSLRALVDHLICRYPVPDWVYGAFADQRLLLRRDTTADTFARVAACLGGGGGYREVSALLYGELNRKIYARLLVSPVGSPMGALRSAQCEALGAPDWLGPALAGHRCYSSLERVRLPVVAWLARHAEQLEFDHLAAFVSDGRLDLANRTWASVRRLSEQPPLPPIDRRPFAASGLGDALPDFWAGWRIRELRSPLELAIDGRVMHHCVATYAPHVRAGATSIWSLRLGEHRLLTLEVRNARREIVQVRGPCNRSASSLELAVVRGWAFLNRLTLVGYAV